MCQEDFGDDNDTNVSKIRDHCNRTGKNRSAAHNIGSLKDKTPRDNVIDYLC